MKISLYRAKLTVQKVHEMSPNIRGVFHEDIQQSLAQNRVFRTPFGRRREFFEKWGKELFREAYAHIPQSTIGDNTKRVLLGINGEYYVNVERSFYDIHRSIEQKLEWIDWMQVLAEMHDGFIAQIPENRVKECYDIVKPIFEQPIDFERCTLSRPSITIPVDCKMGYNWGELKKYKGEDFNTWKEKNYAA